MVKALTFVLIFIGEIIAKVGSIVALSATEKFMDPIVIYVTCGLLAGLGGWLFRHTVNRQIHLNGSKPVGEDVFQARLGGLEDRIGGQLAALRVKLDGLERYSRQIDRRLDRLLRL